MRAALVSLVIGTVAFQGVSVARAVTAPVEVNSGQSFGDDSMTRQSAASLYEADSVPAYEPPVSAKLLRFQTSAQPDSLPAPRFVSKTVRRHHHRAHPHYYAKVEHPSAPASAPVPAHSTKHMNPAMKFFTWWNHLVRGHSWAQVPWAPNDKNPSAGLQG